MPNLFTTESPHCQTLRQFGRTAPLIGTPEGFPIDSRRTAPLAALEIYRPQRDFRLVSRRRIRRLPLWVGRGYFQMRCLDKPSNITESLPQIYDLPDRLLISSLADEEERYTSLCHRVAHASRRRS